MWFFKCLRTTSPRDTHWARWKNQGWKDLWDHGVYTLTWHWESMSSSDIEGITSLATGSSRARLVYESALSCSFLAQHNVEGILSTPPELSELHCPSNLPTDTLQLPKLSFHLNEAVPWWLFSFFFLSWLFFFFCALILDILQVFLSCFMLLLDNSFHCCDRNYHPYATKCMSLNLFFGLWTCMAKLLLNCLHTEMSILLSKSKLNSLHQTFYTFYLCSWSQ